MVAALDEKEKTHNIAEQEAELYDRQIRIWGLDSQKRLRTTRLLMIGVDGIAAEASKNIVLTGIHTLVYCDSNPVTADDFHNNFFCPTTSEGQNKAEASVARTQKLNRNVKVIADTRKVSELPDEFIKEFGIVCAMKCNHKDLIRLDELCRVNDIKFFCGDVFGPVAYFFMDLNEHYYVQEEEVSVSKKRRHSGDLVTEEKETRFIEKRESYVSLMKCVNVDWELPHNIMKLKKMDPVYFAIKTFTIFRDRNNRDPKTEEDTAELKKIREEFLTKWKVDEKHFPENLLEGPYTPWSPICAIVGGLLAQEIINAISANSKPQNNIFLFNTSECSGRFMCLGD